MAPGTTGSKNNVLPIWGNDKTMNLNNLILTNIQSSHYFKVNLFELKTYHEVIDEIYYKVAHLEPWEKGSRKTSGQTGMCGGVRGVGAGGIVSTAFCLLYKLFTLKLTRKQVNGLITHCDSPYIRALGFMYVRYTQPPADLWEWFEGYLEDDERYSTLGICVAEAVAPLNFSRNVDIADQTEIALSLHLRYICIIVNQPCLGQRYNEDNAYCISCWVNVKTKVNVEKAGPNKTTFVCAMTWFALKYLELDVKAGGGGIMTVGEMLRHFMTKLEWYSTLFPRIPVPIQKDLEKKLSDYGPFVKLGARNEGMALGVAGGSGGGGSGQDSPMPASPGTNEHKERHIPDEEVSWGEAERIARLRRSNSQEKWAKREDWQNGEKRERSHHEEDHARDRSARRPEKEYESRHDRIHRESIRDGYDHSRTRGRAGRRSHERRFRSHSRDDKERSKHSPGNDKRHDSRSHSKEHHSKERHRKRSRSHDRYRTSERRYH